MALRPLQLHIEALQREVRECGLVDPPPTQRVRHDVDGVSARSRVDHDPEVVVLAT